MKPTLENTRALGIGDCIAPGDYWIIPAVAGHQAEFVPVEQPEVGRILDGSEFHEYRRLTAEDPIDAICREHGIVTNMGREALLLAIDNIALLDRKQRDYGSQNISAFGEYGVMVRLNDKIERLKRLLRNVEEPRNESLEDTWLDISNYGLIGLMLRRHLWK